MKYGYARASTDDQNPALQLAALKNAACKAVFKDDGPSGATIKRPALLRCLRKLERKRKLTPQQIEKARKLLAKKKPPSREYVADLFKVNRTTLYRALAG